MSKVAKITVSVGSCFPTTGLNLQHEGERIFVNARFAEEIHKAMEGSEGSAVVEVTYDLNFANKRHLSKYRALGLDVLEARKTHKPPPTKPVRVVAVLPHQQRISSPKDYLLGRVENDMDIVVFTGRVATHIVEQLGRPGGYSMMARLRSHRGHIGNAIWEIGSMDQITEELGHVHVSSERRGAGKPIG